MNTRPEGLVVGYDGSSHADLAVDWAAAEAQRRGCALTVLSVTNHGFWHGDSPYTAELVDVVESVAREQAAQGAERARKVAPGLDVIPKTVIEGVAYALIQASRDAAVTVVGSRGHGELLGSALGSVAFTVSAHAHSPVVVVRGDNPLLPGPDAAVVVGADGSSSSQAAVLFAADIAAGTGASLVVVAAYRSASAQAWSGTALMSLASAPAATTTLETSGGVTFDTIVRAAAERTAVAATVMALQRHPDLKIIERVAEGPPVQVLTEAALDCGLLVVGSRGRGAFAALALGSVSHGVIHTATCPVTVVRDLGSN